MVLDKKKKCKNIFINMSEETLSQILSFEDLPPRIRKLLEDKSWGGELTEVEGDGVGEELTKLALPILELYLGSRAEEALQRLEAVIVLVRCLISVEPVAGSIPLLQLVNSLASLLRCEEPALTRLKDGVCQVLERWVGMPRGPEQLPIGLAALDYLLAATLGTKVRKADIRRVWGLHELVERLELLGPACSQLLPQLMATITNPNYLRSKEGRHVAGHLISREVVLVRRAQPLILNTIPLLSKSLASGYGEVFFIAWSLAGDQVKKEIEAVCMQELMKRVVRVMRKGVEMSKGGMNGLAVLSVLHSSRRQRNFSHVLTALYTPILWRALRSDHPVERCNAAQVFLDVFPLETPGSEPDNSKYLERQVNELKELLMDESHFIRVIAIKGVCYQMANNIEMFSICHIKSLLKLILELASDASSYLVRKAVLNGLQVMLEGPKGYEDSGSTVTSLVETLLSQLQPTLLHDDNEKVRKAFVCLLLKVKDRSKVLQLRYWHIVHLKHLIIRLAREEALVGEQIVRLVLDQFYVQGQRLDQTINRLFRLMDWSYPALQKLFRFSENVLSPENAFTLIITMVGVIRKKLKEHLEAESGTENMPLEAAPPASETQPRRRSKNKKSASFKDISNKNVDDENETSSASASSAPENRDCTLQRTDYEFLENHSYLCGLINGATVLWVIFRNKFDANEKLLHSLHTLACACVPMFLKHYKGTPVYYATVNLASLVPIAKLRPSSTVSSACISELKEVDEATSMRKMECLVCALCSWNRGQDVLELAADWLNVAFREHNLNNTAVQKAAGRRRAKVRFEVASGKPLLALKLLDALFSEVLNETRLLITHYPQLFEFHTCLGRVLVIIERRLSGEGEVEGTHLTDEFLSRAYARYLRMIHSLHRPEALPDSASSPNSPPPFDAAAAAVQAFEWFIRVVLPKMPAEVELGAASTPLPLPVRLGSIILHECALVVALNRTDRILAQSLCATASAFLDLPYSMLLMEEVAYTLRTVTAHARSYTCQDEWHLMEVVLPVLSEKLLNVISAATGLLDESTDLIKNVKSFKTALFSFPLALESVYGEDSSQFTEGVRIYLNACVLIIMHQTYTEEELIKYGKVESHSYFVNAILKFMLGRSSFLKYILPTLVDCIQKSAEEGEVCRLASCLSLLYTLTLNAKRYLEEAALERAVQAAYKAVQGHKERGRKDLEDSFCSSTSSINIDIKKQSEPVFNELRKFLGCALFKL